MDSEGRKISRRGVIVAGAALPLVLARPGAALSSTPSASKEGPKQTAPPAQTRPAAVLSITDENVSPLGKSTPATLVGDQLPGPELRFKEGERFQVLVENRLSVPTTVHWHGMIVPNYMDGVPGLTQYPIGPGQSVYY